MERHVNCGYGNGDCETQGCLVARNIRSELQAASRSRFGPSPEHIQQYIDSHPCDSSQAVQARQEAKLIFSRYNSQKGLS